MTETPEQRVERLAELLYWRRTDYGTWESAHAAEREMFLADIRAVIASDREAGMVCVPRDLLRDVLSALDPTSRFLRSLTGPSGRHIDGIRDRLRDAIAAHEQED